MKEKRRGSKVSSGKAISLRIGFSSDEKSTRRQWDRFGSPIYRLIPSIYLLSFFRSNEWFLYLAAIVEVVEPWYERLDYA